MRRGRPAVSRQGACSPLLWCGPTAGELQMQPVRRAAPAAAPISARPSAGRHLTHRRPCCRCFCCRHLPLRSSQRPQKGLPFTMRLTPVLLP